MLGSRAEEVNETVRATMGLSAYARRVEADLPIVATSE